MRWKVFSGAWNAKLLIGFLERLTRQRKAMIFLILVNLRIHHSKVVKQWLAEKDADTIEVFSLQCYSPELTSDEILSSDLERLCSSGLKLMATSLRNATSRLFARCHMGGDHD